MSLIWEKLSLSCQRLLKRLFPQKVKQERWGRYFQHAEDLKLSAGGVPSLLFIASRLEIYHDQLSTAKRFPFSHSF